MEKRLITEIDRYKELMGVNLLTESIDYEDISSLSKLKSGPIKNPRYFILHHTAGRGSAADVVNILNTRKDKKTGKRMILGIQWVIDREGKIFRTLPRGNRGAHILDVDMSGVPSDITNASAEGVEIVGLNDSDITELQCLSALKLVKNLGYSFSQIYGHGEVNSHKSANEGQFCKAFLKKHWGDNIEQLEKTVSKTSNQPDKIQDDKKTKKDSKKETQKNKTTNNNKKDNKNDLSSNDSDEKDDEKNLDPMQKLLKRAKDFKEKGFDLDFTKGFQDTLSKLG